MQIGSSNSKGNGVTMSVVATVLERIRGNRVEAVKSLYVQYDELVKQLASGVQVDADELELVLNALDKSNSDLENDFDAIVKRDPKKSELLRLRQVRDSIAGLTLARDVAARKLEEAVAKLRPRLDELNEQIRFAEMESLQINSLESALLNSATDPTLHERKNSIESLRTPLADRLRNLEPELQKARGRLSYFESQIQTLNIERREIGPADIGARATWNEKVEAVKQNVKTWQRTVDELAGECSNLRREVAGYDRELKTIREEMIVS